jgi:dipeptidase
VKEMTMRKLRTFLFPLFLFIVGLFLSSGQLRKDPSQKIDLQDLNPGLKSHCTSVIVGKNASADGAVFLGHNEDWGNYLKPLCWNAGERHKPGEFFRLKDGQTIPEVQETFAFIWPAAECNGINERQVALVDDTGSCRKELFQNGRGIDLEEFVTLALQRSGSARKAVQTMGGLVEKYGYRSYNGEEGDIFSIADPNEGWWMEVTIGGLWVAQRVPDDQFVVLANRFRIGQVDLKDNTRFLGSSNLIDAAVKRGWYNAAGKPFDFNEVYGSPEVGRAPYNTRREWRGNCFLAGTRFKEEANPLTVVSQKKLTSRDLMALFRDHYEGTEYDLSQKYEKGSPHHTSGRTICVMATDASSVAELRGWLPHEIGGVLWLSAGTPCSSVYVPYYLGVLEFPKPFAFITPGYDRENAFWSFNSLENLVDRYYGEKKKIGEGEVRAIDYVAGTWKNFEDDEFGMRGSVETTALELYKKDKALTRSFLSLYSNALGLKAYNLAVELGDQIRTTYYR